MRLSRRTALVSLAGTALLFSACTLEPPSSDEPPIVAAEDPGEDDPAPPAEEPLDEGEPPAATAMMATMCVTTTHMELIVDGVTFPSYLTFTFEGLEGGGEITATGEGLNDGRPVATSISGDTVTFKMGIMAYGDYFYPDLEIDSDGLALPLTEPYTVDDDQGEASEVCVPDITTE